MRVPFMCFAGWLFALTGNALAAPIANWCTADERVVFACQGGTKTVSFCARGDLAESSGALSYRFGKLGAPVELEVAATGAQLKKLFTYDNRISESGFSRSIHFKRGKLHYSVGHTVDKFIDSGRNVIMSTVVVILPDDVVRIECDEASTIDNMPKEMEGKGFLKW